MLAGEGVVVVEVVVAAPLAPDRLPPAEPPPEAELFDELVAFLVEAPLPLLERVEPPDVRLGVVPVLGEV
jgi:hypothetical protein